MIPTYFARPVMTLPQGYQIGVEQLAMMGAQLDQAMREHWVETSPAPGKLDVDWGLLIEAESRGRVLTVTARSTKPIFGTSPTWALAGYFIGSIGRPANQKSLQVLTELGFWIHPGHRTCRLGQKLLRYVEETARFLDCNRLEMYALQMADGRDAGPLYRRLGYQPAAVQYLKDL